MILRHIEKIPAGKLLRIELDVEDGILLHTLVRGDFFAHPEEDFEAAEAELSGIPSNRIVELATRAFSRPGLSIIGATAADIATALGRAIDEIQVP
ncbi:MAG: biotin--protein ligase [Spirochaetes bacterium]|nr:biotin--protein ligase [Spirochaetota bacterium]